MTASTGTTAPSAATSSATTPAAGESTSVAALSVSTTRSGSSLRTASPTRLSHFTIVPSDIVSPRTGSTTSIAGPVYAPESSPQPISITQYTS